MPLPLPSPRAAFTLTETAVVLVIVGLLLGGVLMGRDLVHNAEIVASVRDLERIKTGIATFKMRRGIPGDYAGAEQRWGAAPACPGNASTGSCNGNANSVIDSFVFTGSEATFFWQHLGLANLIPGNFNPNWPLGAINATHAPHLTISDWGLSVVHGLDSAYFYGATPARPQLLIGRLNTQTFLTGYANPSIPCFDARAVDGKIDDEKPGSGTVQAIRTYCTTDSNPAAVGVSYTPTVNDDTILAIRAD